MAGIFISYRRDETAAQARAVWERLCRELGREHVFMDVDGIPAGEDFAEHIDAQLAGCRLMLVMIGSRWAVIEDRGGRPRLHAANDYVRYEVETALAAAGEKRLQVIPVLIDDAVMPQPDELPVGIRALVRLQAHELDFKRHTEASLRGLVDLAHLAVQAPGVSVSDGVKWPANVGPAVPAGVVSKQPWMSAEGRDAYGRWAEIRVNDVVQRLRWIPPGEFQMGSTALERDRFDAHGRYFSMKMERESPRHCVRLTRGFWLADTACTQALWQNVVGDNPSDFLGNSELPVDSVRWEDVTRLFLPALTDWLAGSVEAGLPTEAQWEYACRAGTESAYSFGESVASEQANFHDSKLSLDGSRGIFRRQTVPVKTLPANPWGLYEMHGNVLEWCADCFRNYSESLAVINMAIKYRINYNS